MTYNTNHVHLCGLMQTFEEPLDRKISPVTFAVLSETPGGISGWGGGFHQPPQNRASPFRR